MTMKAKVGIFGARILKYGRSSAEPLQVEEEQQEEEEEWSRCCSPKVKLPKTDHQPTTITTTTTTTTRAETKATPFFSRSNSHSIFPQGEEMLSFSSSPSSTPNANANTLMISNDGSMPPYHPFYYSSSSAAAAAAASPSSALSFYRNAGSTNVNVNVNMQGITSPFTPSQWMELEYQALIYKHIDANVPVPPTLLIPIRRSINPPSALSTYPPAGSFRSNILGWGSYHPGLSGNADPEPGRCRRTDGKKWRCSRDAVADQKYCERHMNRGRHRSRKLVEGRSGQASSKTVPLITSSSHSTSAGSSGLPILQPQQTKCLQPNFMDPSSSQLNRIIMREENRNEHVQGSQGLSLLSAVSRKPANSLVQISKHQNPFEVHTLNHPRSSYSETISFDSCSQLEDQNSQTHDHPLRHFIDEWPKTQSDHQSIPWPELEDMKSDRTQLSISIPTDFSSSSSSPNQEKLALSSLSLSREFNPVTEENQRQTSWIPISWEPTMGGPLGEALTNTSSTSKDHNFCKNGSSSSLNLLTDGWDPPSPRLESSPTGVLQKTAFGSLSSSTGSSPRADNLKAIDSTSNMCDDLLGSTL